MPVDQNGENTKRYIREISSLVAGRACLLASAMATVLGTVAPVWAHGITERVSVGLEGTQSNGNSTNPAISADGRFVAFASYATNLVQHDTNDAQDVFVYERRSRTTERMSFGPGNLQGNGYCRYVAISASGQFVAFDSQATNLVPGDTNREFDVFVRDRRLGMTERVSVGPGGVQGDGLSGGATISADGRFVAFWSAATNLVPDDTNGQWDVFVHDREMGTTERIGLGPSGRQGNGYSYKPVLSEDGRFVAFSSYATNLVPDDTNNEEDVFVYDHVGGTTRRLSVGPAGQQANSWSTDPAISADGRFIAFRSRANNLVPNDRNGYPDVFVRNRLDRVTRLASLGRGGIQGDSYSGSPAISAGGRFIAFSSDSTNLLPGQSNPYDFDVFVRDRHGAVTRLVSAGSDGLSGNSTSDRPALAADGRFIAFESDANNLVPGDTNVSTDVFVRTLAP